MKDKLTQSLDSLDLQGCILLIGLLSQRSIELMLKVEEKPKSAIIKPNASPLQ